MKRVLALGQFLLLAALAPFLLLAYVFRPVPAAAQGPIYELACPAGSSPLPNGQSFDPATGKYRAFLCVDKNGMVTFNDVVTNGGGVTPSGSNGDVQTKNGSALAGGTPLSSLAVKGIVPPSFPTATLTGLWFFRDGSGSTVTDLSGAGHNLTLEAGGAAPAWNLPAGLTFAGAQGVDVPAALNGSRTWIFFVSFQPGSRADGVSGLGLIWNNVTATTLGIYQPPTFGPGNGVYAVYSGQSGFHDQTYAILSGNAVVGWQLNAPDGQDHIWVNLTDQNGGPTSVGPGSGGNSATAGPTTAPGSGNYVMGRNPFLFGTIIAAASWSTVLSPTDMALAITGIQTVVLGEGIPLGPMNGSDQVNQVAISGDSISCGVGTAAPLFSRTVFVNSPNVNNECISGTKVSNWMQPWAAFDIDPILRPKALTNTAMLWGGVNDIAGGAVTPANTAADALRWGAGSAKRPDGTIA